MENEAKGCARLTGAVVGESPPTASGLSEKSLTTGKEVPMTVRVGHKAPDFSAPAYHQGAFTNIQLSSFLGKWVLLCFYPGDFTFV